MLRSVIAVVAGLFITLALVMVISFAAARLLGIPPGGPLTTLYLTLNLVGNAVAGAAGGATAIRLAPHPPHGHVIALAFVILLLSLPTLLSAPGPAQPGWYGLALSVLGPVSVLVGGRMADRGHDTPMESAG